MKTENNYMDINISGIKLNAMSMVIGIINVSILVTLYIIRWGYDTIYTILNINDASFYIWLIIGLILHEILHGIAYVVFGKVKKSDVMFGINFKTLTLYASCKVPISSIAIVKVCIFPLLILGIVPIILCMLFKELSFLFMWSVFMVALSSGDIYISWIMREYIEDFIFMDKPNEIGFYLMKK
ncbi:DUF3267 domain-containing protein [Caloramator sp. mosi_1]|uniref:DUF3267 domain-containing protein n=1 Tax=Caloramator sp. mosi_1 TaxID=3023090 RepID=UPI002362FDB8|nr:DUF3267 domain-containing protein [Caloramator sp. mosi_1]WDC83392.1 DUF3267 domain-containing protein [Caloramator sp. mosi_1]